jgi:hypothetical protein
VWCGFLDSEELKGEWRLGRELSEPEVTAPKAELDDEIPAAEIELVYEGCGLYELTKEVEAEVDTPRAELVNEAWAIEVELV